MSLTKKELLQLAEASRVSISRARRHIENAARLSDPGQNAELQRSLQEAVRQHEQAARNLDVAQGAVVSLAEGIRMKVQEDEGASDLYPRNA